MVSAERRRKMNDNRLMKICLASLFKRDLNDDPVYRDRLSYELKQIKIREEEEYFLDLYDRKVKFPYNEHNLLVAHLLGLVDDVDINKEPESTMGEFPDIDIDYVPPIQDYLRDNWAPRHFGKDNVCLIGTYGSLGIKSAILDMTKMYGADKNAIQSITVKMEDKDDEGDILEWDKALEIYEGFNKFCEDNPEVADAAKAMLDRNKTAGVHAGGLIICNQRIDQFVPLEVRKVTKERPEGVVVSAWTEGLRAQDLQPVGLIKFDVLSIVNLMQIACACKLIQERHPELDGICNLPGEMNWTDLSYLNDPKAIEMANKADLKCVFQFGSEGIRKLVERGGVTSFDDLVAYSALYRPGPLNMGMDARYYKRKNGEEPYSIHPVMQPILGVTYGVMCYQEQVMRILHAVGGIPLIHCEKIRKAISKKKIAQFAPYKEMFVRNGQEKLQANQDFLEQLWEQIESFAEYGFNLSHATAYTYISSRLLWLKAHYPLEFYAAILMCEKKEDKMKECRIDAASHGVEVMPVNINHSDENFRIVNGKIYFGFSNIKEIGKGAAEEIVQHQPYASFEDFLERYGTGSKVIKALVGLGVFDEDYDRLTLFKFCEHYKSVAQKKRQRELRFEKSLDKMHADLRELLLTEVPEDDPEFIQLCQLTDTAAKLWERFSDVEREVPYKYKGEDRIRIVSLEKQLNDILTKYENRIRNHKEKLEEDEVISLDTFDSSRIKVDDEIVELMTNSVWHNDQEFYPMAERRYYGFQWVSNVERSPSYKGYTIESFLGYIQAEKETHGYIEVEILSRRHRKSKSGTEFYSVDIEDANGKKMVMNVWMDDFLRFKEELTKGTLVRLDVRPPSGGFNTLTFWGPPKHRRHRELPQNKEDDLRLTVLQPGEGKPPKKEPVDFTTLTMD